jgi:nitrous oxidase accessory protein NosD
LIGVTIVDSAAGVYVQQGRLTMRGCNVSRNRVGIDLSSGAVADLGTISGLGNNVIQNSLVVLVVEGSAATSVVPAVGNTWNPVQGADAQGKYPVGTVIPGPELGVPGNNLEIHNAGFSVAL